MTTRLLPAVVVGAALLLGACGDGGATKTGVASLGDGSTTTTTSRGGSGGDFEEGALAFAKCMRQHGVDMPDPQVGDRGGTVRIGPGPGGDAPDFESDEFKKADAACRHHLRDAGPSNLSPEQQAAMRDAGVRFARCMRERGVDVPDPDSDGGVIVRRGGEGKGPRPDDPDFQAAEKECRKHFESVDEGLRPEPAGGDQGGEP